MGTGRFRWVVDGMNVIGSRPDGWWRDRPGAMGGLAVRLRDYEESSGEEVTVVFDGRPVELPVEGRGGPRVVFASQGGAGAADDEIAALVSRDPDPGTLRVVTSDRELAARARARGAEVVSAGAFLRRLEGSGG